MTISQVQLLPSATSGVADYLGKGLISELGFKTKSVLRTLGLQSSLEPHMPLLFFSSLQPGVPLVSRLRSGSMLVRDEMKDLDDVGSRTWRGEQGVY